jgi:flagellum-specific ATP synthase
MERIRRFRYLYSRYRRSRDLISVGAYVPGADAVLDEAIKLQPEMQAFLSQEMSQHVSIDEACAALARVLP